MSSFFDMSQLVDNTSLAANYFEALLSEETSNSLYDLPYNQSSKNQQIIRSLIPQGLPGERSYKYARSRGQLLKNDPIAQHKAAPDASGLNIVWITGMWSGIVPGTGKYSELLAPLGYNVKVVRTLASMKTAGLGRIIRHMPNWQWLDKMHQGWASSHVARNQEKVSQEVGPDAPDIIIGSSQGGAIALSVAAQYQETPMLLLCPAWKIFRVTPNFMHRQSVIIHGVKDLEVPFEDSQELAKMFGVRLIPTNDGHIMKDGLTVLASNLQGLTSMMSKLKADRDAEAQRSREPAVENVNLWIA